METCVTVTFNETQVPGGIMLSGRQLNTSCSMLLYLRTGIHRSDSALRNRSAYTAPMWYT